MAMVAEDIYAALRRRHPALNQFGQPGQWTTIREWGNIDLLALEAWADARVIGYEVKVSRSDMRSELLKPSKRVLAVASTTEFYFAVPHGLLKPHELEYEEPDWEPGDFIRIPCHAPCNKKVMRRDWYRNKDDKSHHRGMRRLPVPYAGPHYPQSRIPSVSSHAYTYNEYLWTYDKCPDCGGKSYLSKSVVEQQAPTLWVPKDVGLLEVYESGKTKIVRPAPVRKFPAPITGPMTQFTAEDETQARIERWHINQLARWISARPDMRHLQASESYYDRVASPE